MRILRELILLVLIPSIAFTAVIVGATYGYDQFISDTPSTWIWSF